MADPITERAIFERKYDGMAAKEAVSRKMLAEAFWLERAAMSDRYNAELLKALLTTTQRLEVMSTDFRRDIPGALAYQCEVEAAKARAVLANYSDEVPA